jgi:carbonic anhydrase
MEYLFDGVKDFNSNVFLEYKELFENIGRKQSPHTLFIGCSDSRLVPNLITKTLPGDLFVIRNIANIVPFYRESGDFLASTSAIEYAVKMLNVSNILICGHSNCGGCEALFFDEEMLKEIPHTKKWLELASKVKEKVEKHPHLAHDHAKREWITEQMNIVEQMNHLLSYPYIRQRYRNGKINLLGWYYIIETGDIYNYDKKERRFIKIE